MKLSRYEVITRCLCVGPPVGPAQPICKLYCEGLGQDNVVSRLTDGETLRGYFIISNLAQMGDGGC